MSTQLVLRLVEAMRITPSGSTARVEVDGAGDLSVVKQWCTNTANSVLAVHADSVEIYRGRFADPVLALPEDRRPGHRLWVYTNFHCNLACDYCCVGSSPRAEPRTISVREFDSVVEDAVGIGVGELCLTGGEPFMLLDMDDRIRIATTALPTIVLTNGMLWRGERLRRLDGLPRENLTLQISLDSATDTIHDRHRGTGSFAKALAGIRQAMALGFRVRVAATLTSQSRDDERRLTVLFDELELSDEQRVVRRLARQGAANAGLVVSRTSLIPEICLTADGAYWHPVAATDPSMIISHSWSPLEPVIAAATDEYRRHRLTSDVLASSFPCA